MNFLQRMWNPVSSAIVTLVLITAASAGLTYLSASCARQSSVDPEWAHVPELVVADRDSTAAYDVYTFVGSDTVLVVNYLRLLGRGTRFTSLKYLNDIYGPGSYRIRLFNEQVDLGHEIMGGEGLMLIDRRDLAR